MFFSNHAIQRMFERGVSAEWVIGVVANSIPVLQNNGNFRYDYAYLNIFGSISSVTVIVGAPNTVVTVWWN